MITELSYNQNFFGVIKDLSELLTHDLHGFLIQSYIMVIIVYPQSGQNSEGA